jgi:magnesium transporter
VSTIEPETIYYVYVLDGSQRLLGVISFRDLFASPGNRPVREVMNTDVIAAPDDMDQEAVARLFAEHDLLALPVIDSTGVLKGIVTVDDIVDVVEEEATEDIQKYGAMEVLEEPYLRIGLLSLLRKRVGWLIVLFLAQLVTASMILEFEDRLSGLFLLSAFIPLIISSGGNSGSQASTLVIRAMAVGEVRLRDWWRVARRELAVGLTLGLVLGTLGLLRVLVDDLLGNTTDLAWLVLAGIISTSLVAVVVFGTLVGSMLPFLLRLVGLDPASASAPLVSTISDVTGLLVYFTIAVTLIARFTGI